MFSRDDGDSRAQILLVILSIQSPSQIPILLASHTVIAQAVRNVINNLWNITDFGKEIATALSDLKALYEAVNVKNQVADGSTPFPENERDAAANGVEIEFRYVFARPPNPSVTTSGSNVSYKYPGTDAYALADVSFIIKRGQLAVIVGFNGSGRGSPLVPCTG